MKLEARTIVANPYSCTVGCSNCVRICPNEAITFPDVEELAATLRRLRSEVNQWREKEKLKWRTTQSVLAVRPLASSLLAQARRIWGESPTWPRGR